MGVCDPRNREINQQAPHTYDAFSVTHAIADFAAAPLFVIGSIQVVPNRR